MASRFSLVLILSALLASAVLAAAAGEDLLIRQVVDGDATDGSSENLLGAPEHHFNLFKQRFGKSYASQEEHDHRFTVFKANLRRAARNQRLDPSASHGVTRFSDLTPREFRKQFLGLRKLGLPNDANKAPILPTNNLPEDFDWREKGAVAPVKNQGSCGSCWSFSTTGALEGAHYLATGELVSLSEQQLVDCDHECDPEEKGACDAGCGGGLMNSAFEYTLKAGGLMREEDYPYTGTDRSTCKFDKSKIAAKVANFSVISIDEDQIAANLVQSGPLADLHRRSLVPLHLLEEARPWSPPSGVRFSRILSDPDEGEAILDHQELVGRELGRERLLQDLQRKERLRS
ncbi:Cysteine protease RD19A [Linum perenne]